MRHQLLSQPTRKGRSSRAISNILNGRKLSITLNEDLAVDLERMNYITVAALDANRKYKTSTRDDSPQKLNISHSREEHETVLDNKEEPDPKEERVVTKNNLSSTNGDMEPKVLSEPKLV